MFTKVTNNTKISIINTKIILRMEDQVELNPVLSRLRDFAESKGGPSKVYNAIGKQVSTYWNLIKNNSKPSVDTLIQIAEVFPDFDLKWILMGEKSQEESDAIKLLRDQLRVKDATIERLVMAPLGKSKGAITSPGVDRRHYKAACHQVMSLGRRRVKAVFTPGRVQESPYAALIAGVRDRVRMQ